MTVSATVPVCYQRIVPKSPQSASPAMKLLRPYGIRLNRGILTARGVRPHIPIALSQRGRQQCNREAKLVFLPPRSGRPQVGRCAGTPTLLLVITPGNLVACPFRGPRAQSQLVACYGRPGVTFEAPCVVEVFAIRNSSPVLALT